MYKVNTIVSLILASLLCTPAAISANQDHMDHANMNHAGMTQSMNRPDNSPPVKKTQRSNAPVTVPVVTPDIPHLPWTMENGVKVFHLTAEIIKREILPASSMGQAKVLTLWGYSGSVPGPTIEVNEGDHVRVVFHNNLPEPTTIHWHGLEIPVNMDGMPFISQQPVKPGGMFVYDFTLHQNGTFFYHSHGAMQEMMGAIGLFIIHPKKPDHPAVQKDFGIILQEFAALQNNPVPNSMAMEFNWLTFNGKAAPATTPLIVRQGDRVRIRLVNLGMDHHPIHIHGNQFYVTGTEGGRIPETAWFPGNTVLVGVAQARDIEFDAKYVGDWMLHCHLPHHMMNNMVSMVGPVAHVGHGMHTGGGMEEGMGIVRRDSATDEELGPTFGRGMGNTVDREQATSHSIGQSNDSGRTKDTTLGADPNSQKGPGYPQDDMMMMSMDAAVAKPENNYLAPGWSGALAGMMNLVRVLPPAKYDQLMRDIQSKHIDPGQLQSNMSGMDHGNMNMPGMDHSKMNMPGMDHSKMDMPGMDHSKMNMPDMDHSKMNMPGMDHSKMNMPGMDHSKMDMPEKKTSKQAVNRSKTTQPVRKKQKRKVNTSQKSTVKKETQPAMPGMDHSKMNMPGMDHSKMKM